MKNNKIINNQANKDGGGVLLLGIESAYMNNNTIGNNYSNTGGGGVAIIYTTLSSLINNIFSGNSAKSAGGGVFLYNNIVYSHTMTNNSFYKNFSNEGGGMSASEYCNGWFCKIQ